MSSVQKIVKYILAPFIINSILFSYLLTAEFRFTNIYCKSLDESFAHYEYCYLKVVNRSYGYMSLKAQMLQVPITNITVNVAILKRANGFKPFLYNVTVDACKFLRQRNQNPVTKYLYDFFRAYSNMNHTCPYNHDLVVDKLGTTFLDDQFSKILPFPKGEYAMDSNWFAYNKHRANMRVYFELK